MLFLFLMFAGLLFADANPCRNGGSPTGDICTCSNGYTGNHCQIEPDNYCVTGSVKVDLDTHVIINSVGVEKCKGDVSNCYATPWSRTFTGPNVILKHQ